MSRIARLLTPLLLLLLAAACTPRVELPGPQIRSPQLSATEILPADDVALPLRSWPAEGRTEAVVLALHGFNDYGNAWKAAAETWQHQGITTYAYDQRGFGAGPHRGVWAGTEAMVDDLFTTARLIREKHPGLPLVLAGESMGGAVILTAMARKTSLPVDRVVLSAPAVGGWQIMKWYQKVGLWTFAHTIPWAKVRPRLKITPSDNIEMLRALGRDPLIIKQTRIDAAWGLVDLMSAAYDAVPESRLPLLMLYGKKEDLIPERGWRGTLARLPIDSGTPVRVALYEKGYHMLTRDLQGDKVIGDIASYILNPAAPLPSGEELPGDELAKLVRP